MIIQRFNCRQRPVVAITDRGAGLHCPQVAGHETAWPGVDSWITHVSYQPDWPADVPADPRSCPGAGSYQRDHIKGERRVSSGIRELDVLMGGGEIPEFNSLLLGGPSGSGKSIIASQFIAEGPRQDDSGVVAIFEELPADFINRGRHDRPGFRQRRRSPASSRLSTFGL